MKSSFLVPVWHVFKWLNRKRLQSHRLTVIKRTDDPKREPKYRPSLIKKVLLVSVSDGWGNSLYLLGLAKRFRESGYEIGIAVRQEYVLRFTGTDFVNQLITMGSCHTEENVKAFSPDIVIDLEYVALRYWDLRVKVLKAANCYSCCLSELVKNSCYFDYYIPVKTICHISERLAKVISVVTCKQESAVTPFARMTENDKNYIENWLLENSIPSSKYVYLNCCARDSDRCFNSNQTIAMINEIVKHGYFIVVNADCLSNDSQNQIKNFSNKVHKLTPVSFQQLTALVKESQFIVTPDTSVTHIATWANRPTFVVFPPNDRDYWSIWRAADVWTGRSAITTTIFKDDKKLKIDNFGFATINSGRNEDYSSKWLAQRLGTFIHQFELGL